VARAVLLADRVELAQQMAAAQFMPIVAAHGLVEALDRSVIERVVEAMRGSRERLSVNVSAHSAEQPAFLEWLAALLSRHRAVASRLVFEMPEHGVVRNEASAKAFAQAVRAVGAGFAIDNFGVHRDSLALLQRLRPAYIKLAGAHTPRMAGDAGTRFFVESLVRAARQLEIPVIAQMVGSGLSILLLLANSSRDTAGLFTFIILLSTAAVVIVYLTAALAAWKLDKGAGPRVIIATAILFIAFATYGIGLEAGLWSLVLLAVGLAIRWLMRWKAGSTPAEEARPA